MTLADAFATGCLEFFNAFGRLPTGLESMDLLADAAYRVYESPKNCSTT